MSALFGSLLPYILMAGAALVAFLGYGAQQRSAGRKAQEAKQQKERLEARTIADEVDNDIGTIPMGEKRKEAAKWARK